MAARYKPYPEYEPSGVGWLGEIPSHWNNRRVGFLFNRIKRTGHKDEELLSVYRDHGVVLKNSRDDNHNKPSEDLSAYQLVCEGDLVLNKMKTWQGSIAISEYQGIVSPAYFVYSQIKNLKDRCDSKYLHLLLRSPPYISQYLRYSKGIRVNQWDLDPDEFKLINALLPPLPEQRAIAAFLDRETGRIDRLIGKQERMIELLKEKRQAVISHAVTKGLNPDAPMKDSGIEWLGEIPGHWPLPKRIHCTSRIGDGLHSTPEYEDATGYYFINGNNLKGGEIVITETAKEVPEVEYHAHYIHLDSSSVLLSINGTIGNVALYSDEKVILGKSAAYMNCLEELEPTFLQFYLQSSNLLHYYDLEVTGTTIHNLSLNSIRQMKACLPVKSEQTKIAECCEEQQRQFDNLIAKAEQAIELMKERRTALISAAVTGKIDVSTSLDTGVREAEGGMGITKIEQELRSGRQRMSIGGM